MNIAGKSNFCYVKEQTSGEELYKLANINEEHYNSFRLTYGSTEIYPTQWIIPIL